MRETRDDKAKHPVGTGAGAVAGAAAGAAAGTAVGGPAGTVVGGVIGAVAGGLAGRGIAAMVDPAEEDRYWREAHRDETYYVEGREYDRDYAPAYRAGYEGRMKYDGRSFDDVEDDDETSVLLEDFGAGERLGIAHSHPPAAATAGESSRRIRSTSRSRAASTGALSGAPNSNDAASMR